MTVTCDSTPMTSGNAVCDQSQRKHGVCRAVRRLRSDSHSPPAAPSRAARNNAAGAARPPSALGQVAGMS